MFGDPWPEEPADPFPEYGEPTVIPGERPRRPGPPRPRGGEPTGGGVAAAVESGLLALTAVFRVGLFALALGPLLVVRGADYWGQVVAAIGVVTCAYGCHRYLVYRRVLERARLADARSGDHDEGREGENGSG